jgi:hypothetical protein
VFADTAPLIGLNVVLFFTALFNTLFWCVHHFGENCLSVGHTVTTVARQHHLCYVPPLLPVFQLLLCYQCTHQHTFCNWFHVLPYIYLWTLKISFQFAQLSRDVLSNKSSSLIYCFYRSVRTDPLGSVHADHALGITVLLFPCVFSLILGSYCWCLRWAEICKRKLCVCVWGGVM